MVPTYANSSERETAFNLLQYFREGDSEKFKKETTRAAATTIFPIIVPMQISRLSAETENSLLSLLQKSRAKCKANRKIK
jgi:hypothetical protein